MDTLSQRVHNLEGETSHAKATAWRVQIEAKKAQRRARELEEDKKSLRRKLHESNERGEKEGRVARATQRSKEILTARNTELAHNVEVARLENEELRLIVEGLETRLAFANSSNSEFSEENQRLVDTIQTYRHAYSDLTRIAWRDNDLPDNRDPHLHRCDLCHRDRNCFCSDEQDFDRTYTCTGNTNNPFKCLKPIAQWYMCAIPQCRQWFLCLDLERMKNPELETITCYRCRGMDPTTRISVQEWERTLSRSGDAYYNPNLENNGVTKLQALTFKAARAAYITQKAIAKMEEAEVREALYPNPQAPPPAS